MAKKIKYQEGDVIAVPLQNGGYASGLVARTDKEGRAFGYFFGPRMDEVSEITHTQKLHPEEAILVCKFGDNSVHGKPWPIVGNLPNYSPDVWKLPFFYRQAMGDNYYTVSEYDDQLDCIRERQVALDDPNIKDMVIDELYGSVVLQIKLTRLLG
ncbi:MAG: immunity 26/phosphotriesterase HocA family protein [Methylotenera sp.]